MINRVYFYIRSKGTVVKNCFIWLKERFSDMETLLKWYNRFTNKDCYILYSFIDDYINILKISAKGLVEVTWNRVN